MSTPISYAKGVDVVPPLVNDPVLFRTFTEKSGTRSEGPYSGIDALAP